MNDTISDFIDYLLNTKNYSVHTATAYESDIMDFINFFGKFIGSFDNAQLKSFMNSCDDAVLIRYSKTALDRVFELPLSSPKIRRPLGLLTISIFESSKTIS